MPATPAINRQTKQRHRVLLCAGTAVAWGFAMLATVHAQGLDMQVDPAAQPAPAHQSGGLDMDLSPTAPITTPVAPKSPIQTLSSGANVQDGIVQVNPGVSEGQAATATPTPTPGATPQSSPAPAPSFTTLTAPPTTTPAVPGTPTPPAAPVQTTTLTPPPNGAAPADMPSAAATPALAEPVSLDHPTVIDTANLKAGNTTVTLFGIDGMPGEAAQNLQGFLASTDDHLTCQAQSSAAFVCLLPDGTDVAQAALINGAARVKDDAPDAYRAQEAAAQAARRGIWASLPPPPATVAHPTVRDTATLTADNQTYVLDGLHGLGTPYADQMQSYIAANGDSLSCSPQDAPGHYICVLGDGTDIAKVALVNGAAVVAADAPDSYRVQQLDALNNHRGIWVNPPRNLLIASAPAPDQVTYVLAAGDDGADGVTYVGGVPEAMIDGEAVFLIYGGDAGWGYYDHGHHWHGAPDRYRAHMERYHPDGHGLRGYREAGLVRGAGVHPEGEHTGGAHTEGMHTQGQGSPGPNVVHPNVVRPNEVHNAAATGHSYAPAGARVGGAPAAGHMVAPGARPGFANAGFVHPGPSAGGFHPGGAPMHASAPVVHASSGGSAPKHH